MPTTPKRYHLDRHARAILTDARKLDPDTLLNVSEAAALLRISPAFLNARRCTKGAGPRYQKIGSRVFYRVGRLRQWLRERERASTRDVGAATKEGR